MNNNIQKNIWINDTLVWITLCALTLVSYFSFESHGQIKNDYSFAIFPIAIIKLSLIYLFFMHMKKAYFLWTLLTFIYVAIIYLFSIIF